MWYNANEVIIMKINEVKSANGKIIGKVSINESTITSEIINKPLLLIDKKEIVELCNEIYELNEGIVETGNNSIMKYTIDTELYKRLYDEYILTVGEIASIFNITYWKSNKIFKSIEVETTRYEGRRNSNYGKETSKEKSEKISKNGKGKHNQLKGMKQPELRKIQISETLIRKYKSGEIMQDGLKQSMAWKNGAYNEVKMGRGYQGYFTSIKYNQTFYFRSLLELNYALLFEEADYESVIFEPFYIPIDVGGKKRIYTPDVLINNKLVIEIKPDKHLKIFPNDEVRYNSELKHIKEHCDECGYIFEVKTDTEIGFTTQKFKKWINNNLDIIEKHNIIFNNKSPLK
jgi:hypothetical protein